MNLTTTYLGLELRSPLVVGAAAPLSEDLDNIKRLEDAGAAAIVLHSLFEEQIENEMLADYHHAHYGTNSFAEALTYFPEPNIFHVGPELYLEHIRRAKEMTQIPIMASLNGCSMGGWTSYARQIEQAGADALELNIYAIPTDIYLSSNDLEIQYLNILKAVKSTINIPVAVKLSPYFSNMAYMAHQFQLGGANALVLFNRFYQPDIDIENLDVVPQVLLSNAQDLRLPMRWIALLYGQVNLELAASSGIHKGADVVRMLMAGAQVTMLVSTLLRHGIEHLHTIELELEMWLEEHEYHSVQQLRGTMSQEYCPTPSEFERVQYMKAIQTYQLQSMKN
jgi:dihydroorotate dehydrogenase (fumarate)